MNRKRFQLAVTEPSGVVAITYHDKNPWVIGYQSKLPFSTLDRNSGKIKEFDCRGLATSNKQ